MNFSHSLVEMKYPQYHAISRKKIKRLPYRNYQSKTALLNKMKSSFIFIIKIFILRKGYFQILLKSHVFSHDIMLLS
ncbi:hypothetical protein G293_04040 [Candidatus Liberibacter africanus PTSAPSY]|uniref:Uncharacterized protein n=1 Tax=Candidatus Liberibacter africanus PTSAPSY TaxID=1277257 RepID=A0A0G3I9I8_LIBAF|nr:hypothetical protein G293_04040 [Candidatus Liberibacter africanus PTSAPSY]